MPEPRKKSNQGEEKTAFSGEDQYRTIDIEDKKKDDTFLLTTLRKPSSKLGPFSYSVSPLVDHSQNLRRVAEKHEGSSEASRNFRFWKPIPVFRPTGKPTEVGETEVPHEYLRGKSFEVAYGYAPTGGRRA